MKITTTRPLLKAKKALVDAASPWGESGSSALETILRHEGYPSAAKASTTHGAMRVAKAAVATPQ